MNGLCSENKLDVESKSVIVSGFLSSISNKAWMVSALAFWSSSTSPVHNAGKGTIWAFLRN